MEGKKSTKRKVDMESLRRELTYYDQSKIGRLRREMDRFDASYAQRLEVFEAIKRFINYKLAPHL